MKTVPSSVYEHTDYRAFLKAAYLEKVERNAGFSLRAFAKHLGLSPAGLTRILKAEKSLSSDRAASVGQKLGLQGTEIEYWVLLVQRARAKAPEMIEQLQSRMNALRTNGSRSGNVYDLSVDHFRVVSDWYHLAILEALSLDAFEFTPRNLARALGIKTTEAELALERLERLELIGRDTTTGKYVRLQNRLLVSSQVPNDAIRKYYTQILAKATASVEEQTPAEKVIGTETFAFDAAQLEEARRVTDDYLNRMLALSKTAAAGQRRDVYQLAVQFFRLTQPQSPRRES